jgi:A/G-specific adenine glycosylase
MSIPAEAKAAMIEWYGRAARSLPWRETRDPYRILVSEIMLQQTQADRVIPKYHEFLERFPTLQSLAAASPADVIRAWASLGYNRRALNLQRTCRAIVERSGGEVPRTVAELVELPGIGPYTAGAIACFAFEQDVGFVDVNIGRVLHRVAAGPEVPAPALTPRQLVSIAGAEVPPNSGYLWNQAVMELGATLCKARSAACGDCPVARWCAAAPTIQSALDNGVRKRGGSSVPFEQTSRYARGRIIDALRGAGDDGITEAGIRDMVDGAGSNLGKYLADLVREGLVEMVDVQGGLAEDAIAYDGQPMGSRQRYRLPI